MLAEVVRTVDGEAARVTANLAESPLAWLARRGLLTRRQIDAGEQLRRDFELAHLGAKVTMRWDDTPRGSGRRSAAPAADPSAAALSAKARFEAACRATGPGLSDVLWRVVCAGEGLETAEKALGWPARAGKLVLGLALDRLADHYGMA
ncbi:MAG: hypothetical protein INF91_12250 [Alphaproteobacteria bacterium]|nr:hypothetical protein [Alphaproteobacteria bacterium]